MKFVNLDRQYLKMKREIDAAVGKVIYGGKFIMGPEVEELENVMADRCHRKYAIACASGTDALFLALVVCMGQATSKPFVMTSPFCFVSTVEMARWLRLSTVFADIEDRTFNLNPDCVQDTRYTQYFSYANPGILVIPNMFGVPAELTRFEQIASAGSMAMIEDAAQSFGAELDGRPSGSFGDLSILSFFPTKPLGCWGDGGMVLTNNDEAAEILRSLRVHGTGLHKYTHVRVGLNSRLDTIQAAILLVKLKYYDGEQAARNEIAKRYIEAFADLDCLQIPSIPACYNKVALAQFSVLCKTPALRDHLVRQLRVEGIPTAIHYPCPLYKQPAYRLWCREYPVADRACAKIMQLPIDPYMTEPEIDRVIKSVRGLHNC